MKKIQLHAYAKINLTLDVTEKDLTDIMMWK